LALVGHNPTLSDLVAALVPDLSPADAGMSTGEAVLIDLPGESPLIGNGRLIGRLRLDESQA
jgi:phosphohistidine phosphatase SixA